MRARFEIDMVVPGSAAQVWERLWALERHTAAVPLTTVSGGPLGPGVRFTGRTALGPVGVDDHMVVRVWEPPRHARVEKVGRVLRGQVEVSLEPAAGTVRPVTHDTPDRAGPTTLLRWRQTYGVTAVPDPLAALARPAVRAAYRSALRRITAP